MNTLDFYDERYFDNRKKGSRYKPKLQRLANAVSKYNPKYILDVGCGDGFLVNKLQRAGAVCLGTDFSDYAGVEIPGWFIKADAKKLPFKSYSFDVIISSDFFEHLAEEDIYDVYQEMRRVGTHLIALISFKPEKILQGETVDTHLTVKSREWWEKKLPEVEIL